MKSFTQFLDSKKRQYGDIFNSEDLAKKFIPFYNNQKRIEIDFGGGLIKRGRIGVTTGWKPAFLLMLTARSMGSPWTLRDSDTIIKTISP